MARVELLGPKRELPRTLRVLQAQGSVELITPRLRPEQEGALSEPLPRSGAPEEALRHALDRVEAARAALRGATGIRAGVALLGPRALDPLDAAGAARLERVEARARELQERLAALRKQQEAVALYERLLLSLRAGCVAPGPERAQRFGVQLQGDPEVLRILRAELERTAPGRWSMLTCVLDERHLGALITVPPDVAAAVSRLLTARGLDELRVGGERPDEPLWRTLARLLEHTEKIPLKIEAAQGQLSAMAARWGPPLERARRDLLNRLRRSRAAARCAESRRAYVMTGYLPREKLAALSAAVEASSGARVVVSEVPIRPEDYDEVPVVLRNRRLVRPFELLVALMPLPRYGSVDPTPYVAAAFPLFFGLILGDAGFGLLACALALAAVRRRWGGGRGRSAAWIALACGASAALFGLLFGEAFGELGRLAGMRPLLLDRRTSAMPMLVAAVAIGLGHVGIGIALGAVEVARRGEWREALARGAKLAVVLSLCVAAAAAAGWLPSPAAGWAAGVAVLAAATALLAGGLEGLVESVVAIGHVLSYARLMALALASVLLAQVANELAAVVRPLWLGVVASVLLHATNFTLGLLSPTITALRLNYVEFFEKFYEPGGRGYEPFASEA